MSWLGFILPLRICILGKVIVSMTTGIHFKNYPLSNIPHFSSSFQKSFKLRLNKPVQFRE